MTIKVIAILIPWPIHNNAADVVTITMTSS